MSNPTQEIFDITAATYDADRAKLIPCYDAFYRRTTDLIVGGAERVLDLGAGTGLLSTFVRTWYPKAHIHLMDVSEPMLERARTRLGTDSNVSFEVADYATAALPHNQDSIVSALSIHHLDNEAKKSLFKKIYAALRPGGTFVNAEQVAGPTPALDAHYKVIWLQQVREAGATPQQIADSLYRQQDDRCASVEDQLHWMREAGFTDADCWFKDNRFAVLSGTKS
ncbi:trans-aconitate 2-methyltransferase [Granulicella mallensis]|jgi:tRNA (cmo5U34)-methyltransferase|uniref:tRNA (Cmo5U34)-methyltransferase n=1 Tax=Granulicella mallensis TaxID=940614 RepID=A0A7W7ZS55_9BACT|nr:class I SAM-dependent methyltransferase [Granulicella mallensis]MBB5064737.1 tRNA (cmo5U34)-methyltransferase [Granulicella mallensis]